MMGQTTEGNQYYINPENLLEMTRLLSQDILLTRRVSGLLPAGVEPEAGMRVLDIGCGPGGWALEVAKAYPQIEVTGIDISVPMIEYAQSIAAAAGVENATYQVMNFNELQFQEGLFDLVNARIVQWFLREQRTIVTAWSRCIKPGGVLRLTEGETFITTSNGIESITDKFLQMMRKAGKTISPGDRHQGVVLTLRPTLVQAGFRDIHLEARHIDFSAGAEDHQIFSEDIKRATGISRDFYVKGKVARPHDYDALQQQIEEDLDDPQFLGLVFFLSAWGTKM
jgi:ubiquinone/menaquinone biosynthesis C-methylase UbiE